MKFSDEDSVGAICEGLLAISVAEKGYKAGRDACERALMSIEGGLGFVEPIETSEAIVYALTAMGGPDRARKVLQQLLNADGPELRTFIGAQAAAMKAVVEGAADVDATVARLERMFHEITEERGGLTLGREAGALGEDEQTAEDPEDTLS
ncbi:hypothetical protein [Chondromyces apiculatus]|nr:hypothetical protein [Chondromyces apiculatus]